MTYRDFKLVQSFSHWRVQNSLPESPKLLISSLISQSSNLSDSKIAVPVASIRSIEEQQLFIQFIGQLSIAKIKVNIIAQEKEMPHMLFNDLDKEYFKCGRIFAW
ncbi:hypothetical protein RDI58_008584 [Solanum bulbocastanum]|uniref:Uncharacterized protein n=1 Tax=Solanum bulbocastanum TaxID=147425 RepID=A0AAN8YKA1_SOLBU